MFACSRLCSSWAETAAEVALVDWRNQPRPSSFWYGVHVVPACHLHLLGEAAQADKSRIQALEAIPCAPQCNIKPLAQGYSNP